MTNLVQVHNAPHRSALQAVRSNLNAQLLEREEVITGSLVALLAREHCLILGPPGTAKSLLTEETSMSVELAEYFRVLMSKFTVPEQIEGGLSLLGLQKDEYRRNTKGFLPEAHFAFLDEIYKANSAIINSLLSAMEERIYMQNGVKTKMPLVTLFGASNEFPEDSSLEAVHDRFMLRYWVPYLKERKNRKRLITDDLPQSNGASMTLTELELCQQEVASVVLPDAIAETCLDIWQRMEDEGIIASDRRWRKAVSKILRAYAYLEGCDEVDEDHLDILNACMWRELKQRDTLSGIIAAQANPLTTQVERVLSLVQDSMDELGPLPPKFDEDGRTLWQGRAATASSHIKKSLREIDELQSKYANRKQTKANAVKAQLVQMHKDISRQHAETFTL
ncbi:MAG: ATPase [Gemmatimonadetes bacterium]|nr:ATPase [Gemmatimonadota bacterium]|tara:strand:- start:193 stop:1371 length:1179 start_codon:yes stop_codon:yes gene_type:complete